MINFNSEHFKDKHNILKGMVQYNVLSFMKVFTSKTEPNSKVKFI